MKNIAGIEMKKLANPYAGIGIGLLRASHVFDSHRDANFN